MPRPPRGCGVLYLLTTLLGLLRQADVRVVLASLGTGTVGEVRVDAVLACLEALRAPVVLVVVGRPDELGAGVGRHGRRVLKRGLRVTGPVGDLGKGRVR